MATFSYRIAKLCYFSAVGSLNLGVAGLRLDEVSSSGRLARLVHKVVWLEIKKEYDSMQDILSSALKIRIVLLLPHLIDQI